MDASRVTTAFNSATLSGRLRVAQECVLLLLGKRRRFKVANGSMKPALEPGQYVVVNPMAFEQDAPKIGDIVVANHPQLPSILIIKRVSQVARHSVHVSSDNQFSSQDSRHFGPIDRSNLIGRVTAIVA